MGNPMLSLPHVLTSADVMAHLRRNRKGVRDLAARGLLPEPTHRYRHTEPAWEEGAFMDWFRSLHDHAVVVPGHEVADANYEELGVYVCPQTVRHVGLARPRMLVMYQQRGRGSGRVFEVDDVETVNQEMPGTVETQEETERIAEIARSAPYGEWTVFHLTEVGRIRSLTPRVTLSRYARVSDVRSGLAEERLALPKLDVAFPLRW